MTATVTATVPASVSVPASASLAHHLDADALQLLHTLPAGAPVTLHLGGDPESSRLDLHRFEVTTPRTRFVVGHENEPIAFDPGRVVLLRGTLDGRGSSRVFLAITPHFSYGTVDPGPGLGLVTLAAHPQEPSSFVWRAVSGGGAAPAAVVCGFDDATWTPPPSPEGAGAGSVTPQSVSLAIDSDFEFFDLFGDLDAAAAYVTTLYAAVSELYRRDLNAAVELSFVRLWDSPDDLFNEPDPLGTFRAHWQSEQTAVERDAAQLITGRRDLPYGGVAFGSGLCNSFGYSVAGWLNGVFGDDAGPASTNWDLYVASHELGHVCGAPHTHAIGVDACASGGLSRGTVMSYCHIVSGGISNLDPRFHTEIQPLVRSFIESRECVVADCDGNGIDDLVQIAAGDSLDANRNGIPDECEDCNDNGVLDPQEIFSGAVLDLNHNLVPDECEPDCNANGRPDDLDIADGISVDQYGNGVPDECEIDCDGDGVSDYTQIQTDMSLDLDRDGRLDACADCDGDGTPDGQSLAGALELWIASGTSDRLVRCHGVSGVAGLESADAPSGTSRGVVIDASGRVLVSRIGTDTVEAFDGVTGAALGPLVPPGAGGLVEPADLVLTPDDRLLVASRGSDAVLEYDATTGDFLRVLVPPGTGGLTKPFGLLVRGDGSLLVSAGDDRVHRFDLATGAPLGVLVEAGAGGLIDPRGLLERADGSVLVASYANDSVLAFDGATGGFLNRFDRGGPDTGFWGLTGPQFLRHGPRGDVVLVSSSGGNAAIHAYATTTGLFQRAFYVLSSDVANPIGFDVMPASPLDCNRNLRLDVCDIADGVSLDADGDGVPDECDPVFDCPFDFDGTGEVGFPDLLSLLAAWGDCPGCPQDLDGDGVVGFGDLLSVLSAWGPCR
ncbi:MAG: hypothetical protein HKN62_08370 [Phycisphaerales bacterium]|nr:hypothetical protein [Phycisphaerales bacterium]